MGASVGMHRGSERRWSRIFLLLLMLILVYRGTEGQGSSPAFWELRPEKVDGMLLPVPDDDSGRYVRLREYFSDLHCTGALMEEQVAGGHHQKNLICKLPGKDTKEIVVAARYEQRGKQDRGRWNDAVMLPLLYNALQAEPRQHTFVFVALCGRAGQDAFLSGLRKKQRVRPHGLIVLDALGLGRPWVYTVPDFSITSIGRQRSAVKKILGSEAAAAARIEGLPEITSTPHWMGVQNTLLSDADEIPSILVSSILEGSAAPRAFHQNFEFLAYYLCRIDKQLANLAP